MLQIPVPIPKPKERDQGIFGRSDSTQQITIRLSLYERESITKAMEKLGFKHIGDFMRQLAISSSEEILRDGK